MSESDIFKFEFTDSGGYSAAEDYVPLGESDFLSALQRIKCAVSAAQSTPDWADDLLRLARAVYLADKRASRQKSRDRWTREICLSVQVISSARWTDQALGVLTDMLSTLTSDRWHVDVHSGASPIDANLRIFPYGTAAEIALFSGGLDSTAYAAQRACQPGGVLLLIGHDLAGAHTPQDRLYDTIRHLGRRQRCVDLRKVNDKPRRRGGRLDPSARSRGFLFAATGVYAAAAHGLTTVTMPENGQLAINPPLTPARLGACSTRSAHPWVLSRLNELIAAIGGTVTVENPFLPRTKGDVCRIARDNGLSPAALARTVSCGAHPRYRQSGNCGYCYPCLIRRSGLHAAIGEDPTTYERHLHQLETYETAKHLRDLQRWLSRDFTASDLLADVPLPVGVRFHEVMVTLRRSRQEIADMLRNHHQWAGPTVTQNDHPALAV